MATNSSKTRNITNHGTPRIKSGAELLNLVRGNYCRSTAASWGKTLEQAFEESRHIQFGCTAMDMLLHLLAEKTYENEHMTLAQACDELVRAASHGDRFDGVAVQRWLDGGEQVVWTRDEGFEPVTLEDICEHARLPAQTRPRWYQNERVRIFAVDAQGNCGWMPLEAIAAQHDTV